MIESEFNCSIIVELLLNPITEDHKQISRIFWITPLWQYGSEYSPTGGLLNIQTASAPHAKCQKSHDLKIFGIFENEYSFSIPEVMWTLLFLKETDKRQNFCWTLEKEF